MCPSIVKRPLRRPSMAGMRCQRRAGETRYAARTPRTGNTGLVGLCVLTSRALWHKRAEKRGP